MSASGTLLSDLDGSAPASDGDLVQKILSDMNVSSPPPGAAPGGRPIPPPMPTQAPMQMQPMAGTMAPLTMDNQIPTSHMIGNEHPTNADFAAAMVGMGHARQSEHILMAGHAGQPLPVPGTVAPAPSKNLYGRAVDEIKIPFVVAMLFFIFSLPPIRVLVAHYVPSMIKATGEFHIGGLLLVSMFVGAVFWLLHRVVAPLLSL